MTLTTSLSRLLSCGPRLERHVFTGKTTVRTNLQLLVDCREGLFLSYLLDYITIVYFPFVQADSYFVWYSGAGASGCQGRPGTETTGQGRKLLQREGLQADQGQKLSQYYTVVTIVTGFSQDVESETEHFSDCTDTRQEAWTPGTITRKLEDPLTDFFEHCKQHDMAKQARTTHLSAFAGTKVPYIQKAGMEKMLELFMQMRQDDKVREERR